MEITYNLKGFKNLLECLKATNYEAMWHVNKSGINIIVVDNGNTTIFKSTIPKTAFKCFNIKKDIKFGLGIDEILKTVKKLKGDFISITNVDDEKISFVCGNVNFTETNIKNIKVPRSPKFELGYEYKINARELFDIIELVDTKADEVLFKDNWISGDSIEIYIKNKIELTNSGKNNPMSKFGINLLLYYKTCFPRCVKTATVKIDKDMPILISGYGENDECYEIFISPRIGD